MELICAFFVMLYFIGCNGAHVIPPRQHVVDIAFVSKYTQFSYFTDADMVRLVHRDVVRSSFVNNCTDTLPDCDQFNRTYCLNARYKDWAREDCPKFCGICAVQNTGTTVSTTLQHTGTTASTTVQHSGTIASVCKDKITNCANYGSSVCTGHSARWAYLYCKQYCRLCPDNQLPYAATMTTPQPSTLNNQVTHSATKATPRPSHLNTRPAVCRDTIAYCSRYNHGICTNHQYTAWVHQNCPYYCGICTDTHPAVCRDTIPDCRRYNHDVCTNPNYTAWVRKYCQYTCRICTGVSG